MCRLSESMGLKGQEDTLVAELREQLESRKYADCKQNTRCD